MSALKLDVGLAALEDAEEISEVLCEAAAWMGNYHRALWNVEGLGVGFVKPVINLGEFVVARSVGRIVGVMMLQWRDLEFWSDHDDNNAAYLHKIAVRREVAGTGIPRIMIEWAAKYVVENGRNHLRLDCDLHPSLCAVYERLGFKRRDIITVAPSGQAPFSVARWQLDAAELP